jgi:tetratricopeptide (TPR) repeat protein
MDLTLLPEDHAEDLAWRFPLLGQTYAELGDLERARQLYQHLLLCSQSEYISELSLVLLALALGEFDCAVDHLRKATIQKHPSLPMVRSWAALNPIRKTESFKSFISEIRS